VVFTDFTMQKLYFYQEKLGVDLQTCGIYHENYGFDQETLGFHMISLAVTSQADEFTDK